MSMNYPYAGEGIKKMYIATLATILLSVFAVVPVINIFAGIAIIGFAIYSLVGLHQAGTEIPGCDTAFILCIVAIVLSVFGTFIPFLDTIGDVVNIISNILVVISINKALEERGIKDVSTLSKVIIVVLILGQIFGIVMVVTEFFGIAGALICSLVTLIAYLVFLRKSSELI